MLGYQQHSQQALPQPSSQLQSLLPEEGRTFPEVKMT